MKILALLVALAAGCFGAVCPGSNGYSFCQSLTIDHTKVPSDQTNYPALVCFDSTMGPHCLNNSKQLATTAHGGFLQDTTNGYDFIITSDSAGMTALSYEAKNHNLTTGASEIWVKVPTVSASVNTTIYLFYGNASVTTDQSNASATWDSNFLNVYHFDFLSGANTTITDTKGNASFASGDLFNDLTSGSAGSGINGIAGGGVFVFNGSNEGGFSDGGKSYSGLPTGANPRTLECWLKSPGTGGFHGAMSWGGAGAGQGWTLARFDTGGSTYWGAASSASSVAEVGRLAGTTNSDGLFHHIAITFPSGGTTFNNSKVYIDGGAGANDTAVNGTTAVNSTSVKVVFACGPQCSNDWYPTNFVDMAYMDECRISNIERSADWLKVEYNNVSNPNAFFLGSTGGGGSRGRTIIIQ
jgi:MSHA biogenesis protein MshQ